MALPNFHRHTTSRPTAQSQHAYDQHDNNHVHLGATTTTTNNNPLSDWIETIRASARRSRLPRLSTKKNSRAKQNSGARAIETETESESRIEHAKTQRKTMREVNVADIPISPKTIIDPDGTLRESTLVFPSRRIRGVSYASSPSESGGGFRTWCPSDDFLIHLDHDWHTHTRRQCLVQPYHRDIYSDLDPPVFTNPWVDSEEGDSVGDFGGEAPLEYGDGNGYGHGLGSGSGWSGGDNSGDNEYEHESLGSPEGILEPSWTFVTPASPPALSALGEPEPPVPVSQSQASLHATRTRLSSSSDFEHLFRAFTIVTPQPRATCTSFEFV